MASTKRGGTYLLTWTTYGTWLPGAKAGFIGRVRSRDGDQHNLNHRGDPIPSDIPNLRDWSKRAMSGSATILTQSDAEAVLGYIQSCGTRHGLRFHAIAIMPTHIHVVVWSPGPEGADTLRLIKGSISRELGPPSTGKWWTRGGSTRLLLEADSVVRATAYVRAQKDPLVMWTEPAC